MARIMAIDFGVRRTGIAVTDPLQIIATALTTIPSSELLPFLKKYISAEQVERIIIGIPVSLDGTETHGTAPARAAMERIKKEFPALPVEEADERLTSRMAKRAMIEMGMKKKERRKKENVDQIAAAIMLQEYLSAR